MEGFPQRSPKNKGKPGHQNIQRSKKRQGNVGQKRSGYGKKIKLGVEVLLHKLQQTWRQKKNGECHQTKT